MWYRTKGFSFDNFCCAFSQVCVCLCWVFASWLSWDELRTLYLPQYINWSTKHYFPDNNHSICLSDDLRIIFNSFSFYFSCIFLPVSNWTRLKDEGGTKGCGMFGIGLWPFFFVSKTFAAEIRLKRFIQSPYVHVGLWLSWRMEKNGKNIFHSNEKNGSIQMEWL